MTQRIEAYKKQRDRAEAERIEAERQADRQAVLRRQRGRDEPLPPRGRVVRRNDEEDEKRDQRDQCREQHGPRQPLDHEPDH